MLIPQSLAYAELAGLDAYFGLYTAFLGVSVYTVLGILLEIFENFNFAKNPSSHNEYCSYYNSNQISGNRLHFFNIVVAIFPHTK